MRLGNLIVAMFTGVDQHVGLFSVFLFLHTFTWQRRILANSNVLVFDCLEWHDETEAAALVFPFRINGHCSSS